MQTPQGDRLSDEVEGPRPQAFLGLALGRPAGDHQNRDPQVPDHVVLQELEPAHSGQAHVEEDGVRPFGAQGVERGLGVVRDERLVADLLEKLSEDLADRLIVVDDQYTHRVCPDGAVLLSSNRRTIGRRYANI